MFIGCLSLSVGYLVLETELGDKVILKICRKGASFVEISLITAMLRVKGENKFVPLLSIFLN
jgi:hypothetical protein